MGPSNNPVEKKSVPYATIGMKALTVGGEVGCLTVIIVLGAVFGGVWLDQIFGTKPLLTILLVIASAPLSLVLTFWVARRAVIPLKTLSTANRENQPREGDETGE